MNAAELAAAIRDAIDLPLAASADSQHARRQVAECRLDYIRGTLTHLSRGICDRTGHEHDADCVDLTVPAVREVDTVCPVTYGTSGGAS